MPGTLRGPPTDRWRRRPGSGALSRPARYPPPSFVATRMIPPRSTATAATPVRVKHAGVALAAVVHERRREHDPDADQRERGRRTRSSPVDGCLARRRHDQRRHREGDEQARRPRRRQAEREAVGPGPADGRLSALLLRGADVMGRSGGHGSRMLSRSPRVEPICPSIRLRPLPGRLPARTGPGRYPHEEMNIAPGEAMTRGRSDH